MKLFLLVGLLAVCVNSYPFPSSDTAKSDFVKWKQFFKKIYDTVEEEEHRFATWLKNMKKIVEHNLAYSMNKKSYRMEMNHFGDMNVTEYKRTMNGYRMDLREKVRFGKTFGSTFMMSLSNVTLPKNLDWVEKGLVTPVKNQGQCGSCWSFSATGSLEGQMMRKTGKLVSLSEQNLIDCSVPEGNQGCNGGLMDQAFDYIKKNKGIDTEESYPYEGIDDKCRFSATNIGGDDVGYKDVPTGNEHALREAVATQGPVSVAIDASQESFQFYSDGLYDEPKCSSEQLDHGVLVVGYGLMHHTKEKYWLVKNSWGPEWGDKGYIRMSRMKDNQCGIATQASYPIV